MGHKLLSLTFAGVFILSSVACGFMGSDEEEPGTQVESPAAPAAQSSGYGTDYNEPPAGGSEDIDMSSQAFLQEVADQLNRELPQMIDSETNWVYTEAEQARLRYKYRLVSITAGDLDMATFQNDMTTSITDGACNNPQVRDNFLDQGVTLEYYYEDMNGIFLTSISVNSGHCR